MAPPKISSADVGGVEVQLTAGQLKAAQPIIRALKEIKLIKDQIVHLDKEQLAINKKFEGHEDDMSEYYKNKQDALTKIYDIYKIIEVKLEQQEKYNKEKAQENKLLDENKKKSMWQLLYWSVIGATLAGLISNSKVLGHFLDVLGSALGFVLDMALLPILPAFIKLVELIFEFGKWIAGLPDPIRNLIAVLTLLGIGSVVLIGIEALGAAIFGVGTAAETAGGAAGVGGLLSKLKLLSGTWIIGLQLILLGAAWATLQWLGEMLQEKATKGDISAGLAYDVAQSWGGGPTGGVNTARQAQESNTTVDFTLNIDGEMIINKMLNALTGEKIKANIGAGSW